VSAEAAAVASPLLRSVGVVAGYVRELPIVHGVDLSLGAAQVLVLLGPNGAGKSTLVKAVAGVVPKFAGRVLLGEADVSALPSHRLAAAGIGFVPQNANVFSTLTVDDNLRVGGHLLPGGRPALARRVDEAYARFPDLAARRRHAGHALSGGQRQMLAMARALMTAPRVLLLDEPSAGLSPRMVSEVFAQIRGIADGGVGVLMVEQNVKAGLSIADHGVVLVGGRIAHTGSAAALLADPNLAHHYLGHAAPRHLPEAAA